MGFKKKGPGRPSKSETVEEKPEEGNSTEPESKWSLREVAVQTEPVIYNNETENSYTLYEAVVELLNRTEE